MSRKLSTDDSVSRTIAVLFGKFYGVVRGFAEAQRCVMGAGELFGIVDV